MFHLLFLSIYLCFIQCLQFSLWNCFIRKIQGNCCHNVENWYNLIINDPLKLFSLAFLLFGIIYIRIYSLRKFQNFWKLLIKWSQNQKYNKGANLKYLNIISQHKYLTFQMFSSLYWQKVTKKIIISDIVKGTVIVDNTSWCLQSFPI